MSSATASGLLFTILGVIEEDIAFTSLGSDDVTVL
ncbi:hypothetical protein M2428_000617 [Arthrobacter sp. ES3-54]|nr:hypothetical protein [Arthrobacter sp. ES3-54]